MSIRDFFFMLLTIFFSSFIVALSGALMPGPLLAATISEGARRGIKAGPLLIIGHGILELSLLVALWMGLAPYLQGDEVFIGIAIAGSAMLFWMAVAMLRSLPVLRLSWDEKTSGSGHLVASGALLSIANPYWTIWWATIGLGYIMQSLQLGVRGVLLFFCGHILADLVWHGVVSAAASRGKQYLNDQLYRALIGCCAVLLIVFACWFGYVGVARAMI